MNKRLLGVSILLVVSLAAATLSAQQKKSGPLTPWGEPDLQGT